MILRGNDLVINRLNTLNKYSEIKIVNVLPKSLPIRLCSERN